MPGKTIHALTLCTLAIASGGAVHSTNPSSQAGPPPNAVTAAVPQPMQAGEQWIYNESGRLTRTESLSIPSKEVTAGLDPPRPRLCEYTGAFTITGLDPDFRGRQRAARHYDLKYSPKTNDIWLSPVRTALSMDTQPESWPPFYLVPGHTPWSKIQGDSYPMKPETPLRLGDKWEGIDDVKATGRVRLNCLAAREETVAGRKCLRVDAIPQPVLPAELKECAYMNGMRPDRMVLVNYSHQTWIDEATGRLVKEHLSWTFRVETSGRVETTTSDRYETLSDIRRLNDQQFETFRNQSAQLDYIGQLVKDWGWEGRRNQTADSIRADELLAAFRQKYPASPFDGVLKELNRRPAGMRRDDITNAAFHKPWDKLLGKPAPAFTAQFLDGSTFDTDKLKGKPALLIFLNPCNDFVGYRSEDIRKFAERWQKAGVQIVGILDTRETKRTARQFSKKYKLGFPVALPSRVPPPGVQDNAEWLDHKYQGFSPVTVVVIDSSGLVQHYRWDLYPEEVEPLLTRLLASQTTADGLR